MRYKNMFIYLLLKFSFKNYKYILIILFTLSLIVGINQLSSLSQYNQGYAQISPSFVRQEILDAHGDWQLWKDPSKISIITLHDGRQIEIENANNFSQCGDLIKENFTSPDIGSVSYISNGKTLNATLWLTKSFNNPSIDDNVDTYPSYLEIKVENYSNTISDLPSSSLTSQTYNISKKLENYVDQKMADLETHVLDPSMNFTLQGDKNSTNIGKNKAFDVVYSGLSSEGTKVKNITFWTINENKVYDITYSAMYDKYNTGDIQNIINSIVFENEKVNDNSSFNIKNKNPPSSESGNSYHVLPKDFAMKLRYPPNWKIKNEFFSSNKENNFVIVQSPFEDEYSKQPSWHRTKFSMALAIDSIQHPGTTDYRMEYSKEPNFKNSNDNGNIAENVTWQWDKRLSEVSANDDSRMLEQYQNFTSFYDKSNPNYILFSFDLSKINLPQHYRAVFYITDYFVLKHRLCRLVDTTVWGIIPPPEVGINITNDTDNSQSTKPLILRSGEEKDIEILIKGNTNLQSSALLSTNYSQLIIPNVNKYSNSSSSCYTESRNINNNCNNKAILQIDFTPNLTSIMPNGFGTSTMHIKALENVNQKGPYSITMPIITNISFPTTIANRAGDLFNNSKSVSLLQISDLTFTILPPYTAQEEFNRFISGWINPISGLWTFLAGVAAVLTPLIIRIYSKKKKNKNDNDKYF
jgi:hypothetical protein